VTYAIKNLAKLTIEGVHDFIVSKVLPRLILLWQKDIAMTVPTATNTCTSSLSITAAADASRAILEEFAKEENTRVSSISSFLKAH
jgi:hypothetical protein